MTDNCISTTYAIDRDGYGLVTIEGKKQKHHRLVYCAANNCKLADIVGKIVMHTCDNASCVNPAHLVLGTHADNTADMWRKGRQNVPDFAGSKNPRAKLNEEDVKEIRKLIRRDTYKTVAALYGVSVGTIYYIATKRTWAHIPD